MRLLEHWATRPLWFALGVVTGLLELRASMRRYR